MYTTGNVLIDVLIFIVIVCFCVYLIRLFLGEVAMKLHLPSLVLGGIVVASLAVNLHASAQEPTPLTTRVTIGEWIFEMPTGQPLAVFPVATTASLDDKFVTYTVAVRHPDGTISGLTECDNVAIICLPSTSVAAAALSSADPNDVFILAGEAKQP